MGDGTNEPQRCGWTSTDPLMIRYHDEEWGMPCHEDGALFERLILESFQAGLSWATILRKREHFRRAFDGWDIRRIAAYGPADVARLMSDAGIVRNRLKIEGAIRNARAFLEVQRELGSFDRYLWSFVGGEPLRRPPPPSLAAIPAQTAESIALSADLRRRGFACDTDYAGRSLKGQLTQAGRLQATTTVIARPDGATIRRAGERDVDVPYEELAANLAR
jgi:DNA-3-methyladenine glycosylase I